MAARALRPPSWLVLVCLLPACEREPLVIRNAEEEQENVAPRSHGPRAKLGAIDGWPMFGCDMQHSGRSLCDFPTSDLRLLWTFKPSTHVWRYERGISVWSSPVAAVVADRPSVFVGCYDNNVYAMDATTGRKLWRYTTGGGVFATPALARIGDRAYLYVASTDRVIHALDAQTGEDRWRFETFEWSYTVGPSKMSSVIVTDVGGRPAVYIGVWNNRRSGLRNVQRGELLAIDAENGKKLWSVTLSTTFVTTPAAALVDGRALVFAATYDGNLHCLDATSGKKLWTAITNERICSSATVATVGDRTLVLIGTRFHSLYAFDAQDGRKRWRYQAGYWFDSTPAIAQVDGRALVLAGSYDRSFYALDASNGKRVWQFTSGNSMHSSPALATIGAQPVVFAASLDDHLYALDARTGSSLWKHSTGSFLWSHLELGDSLWSSPAVACLNGEPMVFIGSYDGQLYAFGPARD